MYNMLFKTMTNIYEREKRASSKVEMIISKREERNKNVRLNKFIII